MLDTSETTFGFREFGWKDGGITINGTAFAPRKRSRPILPGR